MFTIVEKKEINEEERSIVAWGSKAIIDRDKELIKGDAWDLTSFRKNPVLMLSHDYRQPPIGRVLWTKTSKEGLRFKAQFAKTQLADEIYGLYKDGIMKAFSVGFIPKKWEDIPEEKGNNEKPKRIYTDVELLEISCVSVPSCPDALIDAYSNGKIKTKALGEEIEKIIELVDVEDDLAKEVIGKIEETDDYIRIPVKGEEGKHKGHKIRWITVSAKQGIRGIYCIDCKKVITFVFDKKKGWTLEKAKKWMKDHGKTVDDIIGKWLEGESPEKLLSMDEDAWNAGFELIERALEKIFSEGVAKYNCECIKCGYKMTSDKHCRELTCPKCGGQMRRVERPGPGQESVDEEVIELVENEIKSIGGAKDLPIDDRTEWDANAAVARMRKLAGGPDKDNINWDKYRRGFVWYDPKDKENFRAYKLPFADVVNGRLTAIWGGVFRAMAALMGARGGVDVGGDKRAAYNFLVSYYKRFDKTPPEFREYTEEELEKMFPVMESHLLLKMDELADEIKTLKEGRVLSAKNRELINSCIEKMNQAITALRDLLQATEPPKGIDIEEPEINPDEVGKIVEESIRALFNELKEEQEKTRKAIDLARGKVE